MLTQYQSDLEEIATITGGKYYGTSNETELRAAFEEIARSLPVVLRIERGWSDIKWNDKKD